MIRGIGVDIISASRFEYLRDAPDDPFLLRTFTAKERREALGRSDLVVYLTGRFAAKEAVWKSLGLPPERGRFDEIETLAGENGQPVVGLLGDTKEYAEKAGIVSVLLSLSSDNSMVAAFAVCTY